MLPAVPTHCTATVKCDECFTDTYARTTEREIALAIAYLKLRATSLSSRPTIDELWKVAHAIHLVMDLYNKQWREMTRPHDFPKPLTQKPGQTLLEELGLWKPPIQFSLNLRSGDTELP